MPIETLLTLRLGLSHPIIQAPMGGGATTIDLISAVCNAGGLGFLAAAYLSPAQIATESSKVRERTTRPFGINLFVPTPPPAAPEQPNVAVEHLAPIHSELGLEPPTLPTYSGSPFDGQFQSILESGATAFSFTFGLVPPASLQQAKARGMFVMGTATTVDEAIQLEKSGVDAVVAQGSEAGAHRGTFSTDFTAALIGTIALVPQVVDAVNIPVVASGGIMDGRGIAAALALGASAVQMGTAFLTCDEAGIPGVYKQAILNAHEDETRLTRAFSGRPARGITNRFMIEVEQGDSSKSILPYPLQNALTRPMRTAAAQQGRSEFLSLWAGQGVRMARGQPAAHLVEQLAEETEKTIRQLGTLMK